MAGQPGRRPWRTPEAADRLQLLQTDLALQYGCPMFIFGTTPRHNTGDTGMYIRWQEKRQVRAGVFAQSHHFLSARGLNRVQLIGHLGADPEMRHTASDQAVTTFRVAVNRSRRGPDGTTTDETEWFRVVAWEKLAELADQYLRKGNQVFAEGRLQSRKYTGRDGVERVAVEVVASDLILLGGRETGEGMAEGRPGRRQATSDTGEIDPNNPPF